MWEREQGEDLNGDGDAEDHVLHVADLSTLGENRFRRGDCNDDGKVDLSDAVCILNWIFAGEAAPRCVAATNTNGDDATNLSDAIYLLNILFSGGPSSVAPFPDCGPGMLPADEQFGCAEPPDCQ